MSGFPQAFNNKPVLVSIAKKGQKGTGAYEPAKLIGFGNNNVWQVQYDDPSLNQNKLTCKNIDKRFFIVEDVKAARKLRNAKEKAIVNGSKWKDNRSKGNHIKNELAKMRFVKKVVDGDDNVSYVHVVFNENGVGKVTNQNAFTDDTRTKIKLYDPNNTDDDVGGSDDEVVKEVELELNCKFCGLKNTPLNSKQKKRTVCGNNECHKNLLPKKNSEDSDSDDDDMEDNEKLNNKVVKKSSGGDGSRKGSRGRKSTRDNLKDLSDSELDDDEEEEIVKKGSGGGTGKSSCGSKSSGGGKGMGGKKKVMAEEDDESGDEIKEQLVELEKENKKQMVELEKLDEENDELWEENKELCGENEKLRGDQTKLRNDYDQTKLRNDYVERKNDVLEEENEKLEDEKKKMRGQIQELQEQLQQQKQQLSEQPPQQQQSVMQLLQQQLQPLPAEEQEQTQQRQQRVMIDLVRTMINSCGYGDEEADIMERMKAKFGSVKVSSVESPKTTFVRGPAIQILHALVLVAKEEKYSLLQDKLQEELKDLDKFIPELKELQQNVLESKKNKAEYEENLSAANQPSLPSSHMSEDMKKRKRELEEKKKALQEEELQLHDMAIEGAETAYNTKEQEVRSHHKRIATEMEGEVENATLYTKWKKMERSTPELLPGARTSWGDSLKFNTWKSSISTRLSMDETE